MPGYSPGFFLSTTANRAYYDYLTANTEAKAAALSSAVDAINATIDTAIAQKQAEGGDASALMGLKMQMEGTLSGGLDTRSVHSVANHTVDALIALPREALSNAEYASLMSAYRMFEANPSDVNAASVVAAGKQALDSMDIAQLEQSGVLTQSQSRALAEVKAQIENIDSGNGVGDNGSKRVGLVIHNNGYFQITDWNGYPEGKRPVGPFIVLEGEDYSVPRDKANSTNSQLHRQNHSYQGLQIHEVHPVKFGGSPTELSNKVYLTPKEHARFTVWWNRLLRQMNE